MIFHPANPCMAPPTRRARRGPVCSGASSTTGEGRDEKRVVTKATGRHVRPTASSLPRQMFAIFYRAIFPNNGGRQGDTAQARKSVWTTKHDWAQLHPPRLPTAPSERPPVWLRKAQRTGSSVRFHVWTVAAFQWLTCVYWPPEAALTAGFLFSVFVVMMSFG